MKRDRAVTGQAIHPKLLHLWEAAPVGELPHHTVSFPVIVSGERGVVGEGEGEGKGEGAGAGAGEGEG